MATAYSDVERNAQGIIDHIISHKGSMDVLRHDLVKKFTIFPRWRMRNISISVRYPSGGLEGGDGMATYDDATLVSAGATGVTFRDNKDGKVRFVTPASVVDVLYKDVSIEALEEEVK